VLTGLLDCSALYGVLAEIEALGLDAAADPKAHPGPQITGTGVTAAHRDGHYLGRVPFRYEEVTLP